MQTPQSPHINKLPVGQSFYKWVFKKCCGQNHAVNSKSPLNNCTHDLKNILLEVECRNEKCQNVALPDLDGASWTWWGELPRPGNSSTIRYSCIDCGCSRSCPSVKQTSHSPPLTNLLHTLPTLHFLLLYRAVVYREI
jgi:hypothetical protein